MLFNSFEFLIFLPLVFSIYWAINFNIKYQNLFLVLASYIFYGWWDWRFLSLIIISTLSDFYIGIALSKYNKQSKRKILLWLSIFINIGLLGFFKYYNFFIDNFVEAFSFFGKKISPRSLTIILPVGISFYTFQTLSYSIDVYKRKLNPSKDLITFSAFISFFPQLVAGPIERATNLLPQFRVKRTFKYSTAVDGLRQILWGFFKKVVIADTCAIYANLIFNDYTNYSGIALFFGAVLFAFQIYGDFSGYSDIAIGTSRLFGFNLMQNFNFPYFSRDIAEFWRKWHISLSTWFRDYVYIPLGGSKGSRYNKLRNVFVIFLISGFWHGANWTFITWGLINALYFIPLLFFKKNRQNVNLISMDRRLPTSKEFYQIIFTFILVSIAWIFFRSENILNACYYLFLMFKGLVDKAGLIQVLDLLYFKIGLVFPITFIVFLAFEWAGRSSKYALEKLFINKKSIFRRAIYYFIFLSIIFFSMNVEEQEFIYFNF